MACVILSDCVPRGDFTHAVPLNCCVNRYVMLPVLSFFKYCSKYSTLCTIIDYEGQHGRRIPKDIEWVWQSSLWIEMRTSNTQTSSYDILMDWVPPISFSPFSILRVNERVLVSSWHFFFRPQRIRSVVHWTDSIGFGFFWYEQLRKYILDVSKNALLIPKKWHFGEAINSVPMSMLIMSRRTSMMTNKQLILHSVIPPTRSISMDSLLVVFAQ